MPALYRFAGDLVASDLDLPLTRVRTDPGMLAPPAAVTVDVVHHDSIEAPDMATTLHHGSLDGAPWRLGTLHGGAGWAMVLGHGCVATLTADRSAITLHTLHGAPPEWLAEATTAWALVYRLSIAGLPTFHASAVTLDGRSATAICGSGHSGKSTMAGAVIAQGGSLLADDVLAVDGLDDPGAGLSVLSTAASVKLRGTAKDLGERLGGASSTTFDERLKVESDLVADALPLDRLVFLEPDAPATVTPISAGEATVKMLNNSKVGMWNWEAARDREFEAACIVAEHTPAFMVGRGDGEPTPDELIAIARTLLSS